MLCLPPLFPIPPLMLPQPSVSCCMWNILLFGVHKCYEECHWGKVSLLYSYLLNSYILVVQSVCIIIHNCLSWTCVCCHGTLGPETLPLASIIWCIHLIHLHISHHYAQNNLSNWTDRACRSPCPIWHHDHLNDRTLSTLDLLMKMTLKWLSMVFMGTWLVKNITRPLWLLYSPFCLVFCLFLWYFIALWPSFPPICLLCWVIKTSYI